MYPSKGKIVIFHFMQYEDRGTAPAAAVGMRSRPAIVIEVSGHHDGGADLFVMWHPSDQPHTMRPAGPIVAGVFGHRESAGELGRIEREEPEARTWSWPPRFA